MLQNASFISKLGITGVSERSGSLPWSAYTRVGLFTTQKIFSISWKKKQSKSSFDTVPKFPGIPLVYFTVLLDHTEIS